MFIACAAGLVALALALRLYTLGAQELWLDEAFSFHIATQPDWLAGARADNTPPLYYLFLRFWLRLAGTSEAAVRALSALAGGASVAAAVWLARRLFDRATGLWSGLVLALSPIAVYYAQEARAYALLVLLLLIAAGRLWIAVERNRLRDWVWAALSMAAALYTHYLALLAIAPMVALPLVLRRPERVAHCGACAGGAALLFLPWAAFGFAQADAGSVGVGWIRAIWERTPPALAVPRSLEIFGLGSQAGLVPLWLKQFSAIDFPPLLRWMGLAALGLVPVSLWVAWGAEPVMVRRATLWLVLAVLAPLALLWTASLGRPLYAAGRYDTIAYPAFPLLVGAALLRARRDRPLLFWTLVLGLGIPIGAKLYLYYRVAPDRPAAASAETLGRLVRAGDAVVFTGVRALPVFYYLERIHYSWRDGFLTNRSTGETTYCRMFPRASERTPAALDASRAVLTDDLVRREVDDQLAHVGPQGTVWVAFESGSTAGGRLRVPEQDALLVRELERRQWRRRLEEPAAALLIVQFRRD